jgi:Short C-terminal domain/Phospholipase_D-nuclease N-terminal
MPLAADYPFLDILGSMLIFFGFVIWLTLLFTIFADLFRRHDVSGWGKAGWTLFVIVLPFLGVLVYLGTQGKGMAERRAQERAVAKAQLDDYVREVAGSGDGAAAEIAKAKELLDSGAISQAEYDAIKQKALS